MSCDRRLHYHHFKTFFDENFPGSNDQRHILRWANHCTVANRTFSLGWKMASGRPYSKLEYYEIDVIQNGMDPPRESIRPVVKAFNTDRLPLTHQLDISVHYYFKPSKEPPRWNGQLGLPLVNVYHQNNLYNRGFLIDNRSGVSSF